MLTAVATVTGADVVVLVHDVAARDAIAAEEHTEPAETQLNPIAPEVKEILWGFGSFVVLAVLMRYVLYPRLRQGMDARRRLIESGHDQAEQVTSAATNDVAQYEEQLGTIRLEAMERVNAARATLERERAERLAEVNARIGEKRAAAAAEVEAARAAAQGDVEAAVRSVASQFAQLATGRRPDDSLVERAVADALQTGATR